MTFILYLQAALMGVVEGLTEFLPVSSTGHLIVAGSLMGFDIPGREVFIVAIQAAAILAVCWEYRARLWRAATGLWRGGVELRFALNVLVAFLPAAVLGVLLKDIVQARLFGPVTVAVAFILGGVVMLWAEGRVSKKPSPRVAEVDAMTWRDALKVGAAQCFALIPGVSRSGATIVGALLTGISRRASAEFSFFLAIPTIVGASVYALWSGREAGVDFTGLGPLLAVASASAFVSAFVCVRWLLKYVSSNDFKPFAWYRIAFGVVILATWQAGWVAWP